MHFDGVKGDWLVAFKDHALERICERTVYDWRTYGGHGEYPSILAQLFFP
jgi:hypothetical protein